jgi:hypothetical protein
VTDEKQETVGDVLAEVDEYGLDEARSVRLKAALERERAEDRSWAEKHAIVIESYNKCCDANEHLEAERAERREKIEAIAEDVESQARGLEHLAKRLREIV